MPQTIQGGTKVGTSGNDDLRTLYYDIGTAVTTIYSALSGLAGNDHLNNNGAVDNVTLDGGAGDDEIYNNISDGGQNPSIVGGAGNDYIQNGYATDSFKVNNATIDAGAGADTVDNYGDNPLISGGDGDNRIYSVGDKATITGGNDNDSISNYGDDSSIDGGNGNDWLEDWGSNVTVSGGTGNDTLRGGGGNEQSRVSNVLFEDTIGNNRFSLFYTTNGTINAGTGDDTVYNDSSYNKKILINVGAGNNSVYAWYDSDVTIQAQNGNDSLYLQDSSNMSIDAGDGANYIDIDNLNDSTAAGYTINAGTGNDTVHVYRGHRALISTGGGDDSINNVGHNSTINGGDGDDWINNHGGGRDYDVNSTMSSNNLIDGGAGNDSITNGCDNVTINGGDNDDYISSAGVDKVLINGGDGNDTIENIGNINREVSTNFTLNGGAGDDYIYNLGNKVTITAGTGNDTVLLATGRDVAKQDTGSENVLINYSSGDGNDLIKFFNATSTLSIGGGNYSSAVSGNDVILTVGNGKITLSEAATLDNLNIVGDTTAGDTTSGDTTSGDTTSGDTTSGDTTLADTVKAAVVADMILHRTEAGYPVIAGLAFHPEEYHGDEPTNYAAKETWSITSKDGLELNGIHYTPENSNDKWVIIIHGYGHNHKHMYPFAGFYLANGYNVLMVDQRAAGDSEGEWLTMGAAESQDIALWTQEIARRNSDAKITLFGVSMGSATAMLAASRSDIKNVTSLVEDCGYTNMMDVVRLLHSNIPAMQSLLSAQDLPVLDTVASVFTGYNLSDAAPLDSISNAKMPSLFITGSEDAVVPVSALTALYDASGADVKEQFIVQGATHGVAGMYDLVGYSNTTFRFLAEANGEGWVTENITDDILLRGTKYNDSISNSGSNVTIDAAAGNDSIQNNEADKVTINGGAGNDTLQSDGSNVSLSGGTGNDILNNGTNLVKGGNNVTIDGGAGNDELNNLWGENISMSGGAGADTLQTNAANVTMRGGAGNDRINLTVAARKTLIQYASGDGNDFVTGFDGDDTLNISGASYSSAVSGDNVVFTVNGGKITLEGAASLDNINITTGSDTITTPSGEGVTINNTKSNTLVTGTAYADTITNSGKNVTVNALAGNDSITSKGSNVSIDAGAGNDSIYASGTNSTIDGGDGSNFVDLTGSKGLYVVFNGQTTVDGFNLGFGSGSDTVYIPGAPAGVDFRSGVLTFYDDSNALVLSDVTTTAKVNLYHESRQMLNKGVFIADNDWYSVERGDLSVKSGEEVYFVGSSATQNHGVDFSGISSNLNLTLDTAYIDSEDYVPGTKTWINGVYSIRGGAGLTTITGSDKSDTIFAGTGRTTINARGGNDYISLASAKALVEYSSGDGNDVIAGFNKNSTLNISGTSYSSSTSGDNVILTVGSGKITLEGAASLDNLNITSSNAPSGTGVTVDNSTDNTLITGTAYNDTIYNSGRRVTIRGLAGDDYIANDIDSSVTVASQVANLIDAGAGNDTIYNHHSYHPTLLGGDGNDSIVVNKGHRIFADGGAGNDSIIGQTTDNGDSSDWAMGGYATILGGDGNDYISPFYSNNATINGGSGNDTIIMMGADSTINGAAGDDQISLGTADSVNVLINYASGDGNDLINGFTENDTLNLTGAKYYSVASGNDLILTVGNGHLTLRGAATLDDINIIGSYDEAADEIISNTRNAASVIGTSGNDTITNTGSRSTIDALAGDDSITSNASNVLLYAGDGSDTILASGRLSTIDGGDGSNYVSVTGSQGLYVVMDGNTTVDGFNAGFGSGADTILINGDAPSVDFRSGGLTLYNGSQSILLDGVTSTAKLHLYYADSSYSAEVFIADNDLYKVTDNDLRQGNLYFVGATASPNHGIDFSDITRAVNVTLDTDYSATPAFWVNNIHSIVGGAGSTTITGSDKSDTIVAGTGNTTINAGEGNDNIALNSSRAIVNYSSGDGNDFIAGFNANSTLNIYGADFTTEVSGSDVVLSVGSGKLTLEGAADLDDLNIVGRSSDTILPADTDVYSGGDQTISSYAGQPVVFSAEYQSSSFDGLGNFVVYSSDGGTLTIQNVVDKVVDLRDADGNEALKAYSASTAGVIDGRGLNGYQIIDGAANGTDIIYTADNGSKLWGGDGNIADALIGGEGTDIFIAGQYQGADNIFSAGEEDIVYLSDAALSDILAAVDVGDNKLVVCFKSGGAMAVNSDDSLSATFYLSDGSTHTYNHTNKTWQSA